MSLIFVFMFAGRHKRSESFTMKVFLLLTLLTLCHAKPYTPINVMDFMMSDDIMQQDADDDDDDDYNDYDDDDDNFVPDCPDWCRCSKRVLQCSDQGKRYLMLIATKFYF